MGCHTWFNKRVDRNLEEAKANFLRNISKAKETNESVLIDKHFDGINWTDYASDEDLIESIKRLSKTLEDFHNGLLPESVIWENQLDGQYVDGKGFYIHVDYHDVFRKYGYPEDKLFSLQETLDYINDPKNECVINDTTVKILEEFWKKYPDGMIYFG